MGATANYSPSTNGVLSVIPQHVQPGLSLLLQAYDYAHDLATDVWDFAVEIQGLHAAGLNNSDLRWLVCKRYVEVRRERHLRDQQQRCFARQGMLIFAKYSCFVLTPEGAAWARQVSQPAGLVPLVSQPVLPSQGRECLAISRPLWDPDRHQFRVGEQLVKEFKLPSPNQETILMAFEEEGWPPCIDDPLPPESHMDSKQRLRDAIKSLNRHQKSRLVCFMGNGRGDGVRWEFQLAPATLP